MRSSKKYQEIFIDIDEIINVLENVKKLKEANITKLKGKVLPVIKIAGGDRKGIRIDKLGDNITELIFVEIPNLNDIYIVISKRGDKTND